MKQEQRTVCFDERLGIEAYRFIGVMQKFPNHFHPYYVLGFIEDGHRSLSCKNKTYTIGTGDLILFNPMENHTCAQTDDRALDYRCLNVTPEVMQRTVLEITGRSFLPEFTTTVAYQSEQVLPLKELHQMLMEGQAGFTDQSHFTKYFKNFIGLTPKQYQNIFTGSDGPSPSLPQDH